MALYLFAIVKLSAQHKAGRRCQTDLRIWCSNSQRYFQGVASVLQKQRYARCWNTQYAGNLTLHEVQWIKDYFLDKDKSILRSRTSRHCLDYLPSCNTPFKTLTLPDWGLFISTSFSYFSFFWGAQNPFNYAETCTNIFLCLVTFRSGALINLRRPLRLKWLQRIQCVACCDFGQLSQRPEKFLIKLYKACLPNFINFPAASEKTKMQMWLFRWHQRISWRQLSEKMPNLYNFFWMLYNTCIYKIKHILFYLFNIHFLNISTISIISKWVLTR